MSKRNGSAEAKRWIGLRSSLILASALALGLPLHSAGLSAQQTNDIQSLALPLGERKGSLINLVVPPDAHISEVLVWYNDNDNRINGLQLRYQQDLQSKPMTGNFAGRREGRLIRTFIGWNDFVTGISIGTTASGALTSFELETFGGKRGFFSPEVAAGTQKSFGPELLFSGLSVGADKDGVYAIGILTVPAQQAPKRASYNQKVLARSQGQRSVAQSGPSTMTTPPASVAAPPPAPTRRSSYDEASAGFARALNKFNQDVARGQREAAARRRAEAQKRERERRAEQARMNAKLAADRRAAERRAEFERADRERKQLLAEQEVQAIKASTPAKPKPRKPDDMQWTPAGVKGTNIGAAFYDRIGPGAGGEYGRFEIIEEGSDKWNWYIMGPGGRRKSAPHRVLQVKVRTANEVVFADNTAPGGTVRLDLRTKRITAQRNDTSKLVYFAGTVKTISRPLPLPPPPPPVQTASQQTQYPGFENAGDAGAAGNSAQQTVAEGSGFTQPTQEGGSLADAQKQDSINTKPDNPGN